MNEICHSLGPDTLCLVDWHCGEKKEVLKRGYRNPLPGVSLAVGAPQGGWMAQST